MNKYGEDIIEIKDRTFESNTEYGKNETMKLLGMQISSRLLDGIDVIHLIDEVAEARPYTVAQDTALDIFTLGFIYGKHAERQRLKKHHN